MSTIDHDKFYQQQQEDWAARDAEVTRKLNEENTTTNTTISTSNYDSNSASNVILVGTAGNDTITNSGDNVTIDGGAGNDSIRSVGSGGSISGGTGNDRISIYSSPEGFVLQYANGDGNDTIYGWSSIDTLYVEGSYTTQKSDDNIIVTVGDGSIIFRGYSDELKIGTASTSSVSASNAALATITANALAMNESMRAAQNSTETTTQNIYTGGDQVISNYTGEPVTLSGSFSGANFSGNNFVVNSSAGTLTIQNVTDKVIDLRDASGNEFIKAYMPSLAGVIDGTGINGYEIITGSAAGTDVIFAGDGGSQLWGGAGDTADALVGGNGSDIFIGGRYQGSDNFLNVSSADVVNLTDATLSDIVAAVGSADNVLIGFNTGNIISIQSTDTLSAAINLADGTSWRFNHSTQSWQGA